MINRWNKYSIKYCWKTMVLNNIDTNGIGFFKIGPLLIWELSLCASVVFPTGSKWMNNEIIVLQSTRGTTLWGSRSKLAWINKGLGLNKIRKSNYALQQWNCSFYGKGNKRNNEISSSTDRSKATNYVGV